MKTSWRFLAGLVGGFSLLLAVYVLLFILNLGVPTEASRWCYEINQKKHQLAARISRPKLLLVGGSATHFGIKAKTIQEQTGWPTVNLGTHAVLGITYILRQTQEVAKPGDVVLLGFEYELYPLRRLDPRFADAGFIDYVLARDPEYFWQLPAGEQWSFFMLTSTDRIRKGLKNLIHASRPRPGDHRAVYDAEALDECGDQTGNLKAARHPDAVRRVLTQTSVLAAGLPEHPAGFAALESFCRWAQTNHIRVLVTYPTLCDKPEYHSPIAREVADQIREFFGALNVPTLGDYTDSLLPPESFFDTMYHLTQEAASESTRNFLPRLERYLGVLPAERR